VDLQRPFGTPGLTMNGNVSPSSDNSEDPSTPDSPFGQPLSPSSGSDSGGPSLKRQKISYGTNNLKAPIRTTGVMLLAFIVSFGIFYSLLGIIPDQMGSRDSTPLVTFRGRSLQQISEETQAIIDGLPKLGASASTPEPTSTPYMVVIPSSSERESKTQLSTGAKEKMAMVSLLSLSEARSNDQDGRALDIYSEPEKHSEPTQEDLLVAYKKILLSSNFSLELGASYLFCPAPVQIQSNLFPTRPSLALSGRTDGNSTSVRVETKDSQRRAKRLRRAGLDVTNSNKRQRINESEAITTNTSDGEVQRLNFWVPTASLYPHWSHLHIPTDHEDNPRKISGLSEINCVISSIRPVLIS